MRYLLQLPLPDELLGSVWIRTARHAGLPIGTVTQAISGGRKWSPSLFASAHLADLATTLRCSAEDLLWQHTVFPYATAYLDRNGYTNARASALAVGRLATGMGAVTQSVSDHVRWRRYCPNCVRADLAHRGESYWRRSHHLPGVLMCCDHGTPLRQTTLPCVGHRWFGLLPHECPAPSSLRIRLSAFDAELMQRSVALLRRPPDIGVVREGNWYRDRLVALSLLAPDRFADSTLLRKWGRTRLPRDPSLFGLSSRDADMHWLAMMVRPRSGVPFIPLKHLLFETLLSTEQSAASAPLTFKPPGPSAASKFEADERYAAAVRDVIRRHIDKGARLRVRDALSQAGCWESFRHDRECFPRVQSAIRWLKRSAACCRPNSRTSPVGSSAKKRNSRSAVCGRRPATALPKPKVPAANSKTLSDQEREHPSLVLQAPTGAK